MRVSSRVEFVKSSWIQVAIHASVLKGLKSYYKDLEVFVNSNVQPSKLVAQADSLTTAKPEEVSPFGSVENLSGVGYVVMASTMGDEKVIAAEVGRSEGRVPTDDERRRNQAIVDMIKNSRENGNDTPFWRK
ncbi:hypothetical protein CcCBS67573_g09957 [Chytriomyces confervae]|uniref:Uncharacterized protein n=1 Tax=Chytriomyces confervae TaxID=246404 RepID=A0A507DKA4_9FUNG|nr:hypothetical protein CcCBS67573_g09957 [Chytriomyces confervae]